MKHHKEDNKNYAFLNGISDRLINWIAKRLYVGYKKTTDLYTNMHISYNELESANDHSLNKPTCSFKPLATSPN